MSIGRSTKVGCGRSGTPSARHPVGPVVIGRGGTQHADHLAQILQHTSVCARRR